jgi:AcrR family transcriptional regulator
MLQKTRKAQTRDPEATKARILAAAEKEFAKHGLGGGRVDRIASRAKTNKRMLYHYFGNKAAMFALTVENAYVKFRMSEAKLELDRLEPVPAVRRLLAFTWDYFIENPEFITLVNSENLHRARHIRHSKKLADINRQFVGRMADVLSRGAEQGLFRPGLDPVQVQISIAAIGYYYLTNRYTAAIVFERDMMTKQALAQRLAFNTDTVLRMLCTPETLLAEAQKGSA